MGRDLFVHYLFFVGEGFKDLRVTEGPWTGDR